MRVWLNRAYVTMALDLVEYFRYRMAVISSALTPLAMILAFGIGMRQSEYLVEGNPYLNFIVPGILALGVMFSCIFSAGYTIMLDRQRRLIDDIVLSPVSYSAFIIGRLAGNIVKSSVQFVFSLAGIIFWLKMPLPDFLILGMGFVLSALFFGAVGMILASFCDIFSFAGFANLITVPFMYFCGVFFPITYFEGFMVVFHYVPFTAAIEIFRYAFFKKVLVGTFTSNFLILLISTVVLIGFGVLAFKKSLKRG